MHELLSLNPTQIMRGNLKTVAAHTAVWLFYTAFAIVAYGYGNIQDFIFETTFSYLISSTVFYTHVYWLLPKFFDRKRTGLYLLSLLMLCVYNFAIRYFCAFWLSPFLYKKAPTADGIPLIKIALIFTWHGLTFILLSAGYWFAQKQIRSQKDARIKEWGEAESQIRAQQEKLILQQTKANEERLVLENAALRAQINPHFFVNTLNLFRIESEDVLPQTSKGIGALIEFLRVSITRPDEGGMIPLYKEIGAMESLIHIFRRRFQSLQLSYKNSVPLNNTLKILPHVLVTFVENAIKHGQYAGSEIAITLTYEDGDLFFHVKNRKGKVYNYDSRGIGLMYIKRHLENGYKNLYSLDIKEEDEYYTVDLHIQNIGGTKHAAYNDKLLYS